MIEKILLCQHPHIEKALVDYLCSAILIFKENQPINHAYCDILVKDDDIHIKTEGWSITNENVIKRIQMYVRNKIDVIEGGKLPTFEFVCKQRNIILKKQSCYFEEDFESLELIDEKQRSEAELDIHETELRENMHAIVNKVNKEWKK